MTLLLSSQYADPTALAVGESSLPRLLAANGGSNTGSGTLRFTHFTATKSETITQLRLLTGNTAAAATPTLVRAGVYSEAANGDLTLVGAIPSDTSLFASGAAVYTRTLSASFQKVAGQRYAVGVLVVTGAAPPTLMGSVLPNSPEGGMSPRVGTLLNSQTDLPASVPNASLVGAASMHYVVLLP